MEKSLKSLHLQQNVCLQKAAASALPCVRTCTPRFCLQRPRGLCLCQGTLEMNLFFVSQPGRVAWSSAQVSCTRGLWSSRVPIVPSHADFPVVGADAPPWLPALLLPRAAKREVSPCGPGGAGVPGSWHAATAQIAAAVWDVTAPVTCGWEFLFPRLCWHRDGKRCCVTFGQHKWG